MPQMKDHRPNLLYIHSDEHNAAVTGCYGDPLVKTPHLDTLAQRGVVLENVYCPSPLCVPSRMSMLTGRFPYENEVWANEHILDSSIPTFAHAMGAGGYRPILIGRLHSRGPDQLLGYAERLVGDHSPNHPGALPPDHGALTGTQGSDRRGIDISGVGQSAYQVHDEFVTAATVDLLNQLGVRKRATGMTAEPFCITAGFMLPHAPFVARRKDYEVYKDMMTMPRVTQPPVESQHPYVRWYREKCGLLDVSPELVLRCRAAYWGLVTAMDSMIGEILRALQRNDLEENTLVIYMSDHGDMVGEQGLWWKRTPYEGAVKVPAIVSWPGVLPEGARCDRVISSLDLNATMLDALEVPPLPHSHGRSILELLRSPGAEWDDVAFSEHCSLECHTEEGCYLRTIRRGDWKLNYYHGMESELFNLREDPDELDDRVGDPACRDVREKLTQEVLQGWNPEAIAQKMAAKNEELEILKAWACHTKPEEQYRWNLLPEMDHLNG